MLFVMLATSLFGGFGLFRCVNDRVFEGTGDGLAEGVSGTLFLPQRTLSHMTPSLSPLRLSQHTAEG